MSLPHLIKTEKGNTIEYRSKYLYSKFNPLKILKLISSLNFKENCIYIFPSPLLFYGYKELENKLPDSSLLICIEIDPALYNLSSRYGSLTYIKTGFDFLNIVNNITLSNFRSCELLNLNGGYILNKKIYDKLHSILLSSIHNFWKNRITTIKLGQLWTQNTINNLKLIKESIPFSQLKTNKPIIITGAGESLELTLSFIKQNRIKLFVLTVDTALQTLLEAGIKPDVVLALESQFYNLPDFYGAKDLKIDVIYDLSSYPGVLRCLKGKKFYSITKYTDSKLLNEVIDKTKESPIPPLGSVGITALYMALKITSNYIYTTGLDFSYKLGKTHSKGTPYHISSLTNHNRIDSLDNFKISINRPLLKKVNKSGTIENTDKILHEYSIKTKELLYGINRVYDLTTKGMDIGLQYLDPNMIRFEETTETVLLKPNNYDLSYLYNTIKKQLKDSINTINDYIHNKVDLNIVKNKLSRIDYLFIYFPEVDIIKNLDNNNILRLYYSLLRYNRIIY